MSPRVEWRRSVQRADLGSFGVVKHRMVLCPGYVVERVLGRAAHVDAVREFAQRTDIHAHRVVAAIAHPALPGGSSSGFSARQTLSSNCGCAACNWVDAIRLEHRFVFCESLVQKRHERGLARLGDVGEGRVEALHVRGAVVGRHAHADHQYARTLLLRRGGHRLEILPHRVDAAAAQPIVATEFDDGDGGTMLRQQRVEAGATAGRGVTADAGVDHGVRIVFGSEPLLQERRPTGAGWQAVARRNAVAKNQDDGRRRCVSACGPGAEQHPRQESEAAKHGRSTMKG